MSKKVYPKEATCIICDSTFYILNANQGKDKKTCSPRCKLESNRISNIQRAEEKWGPKVVKNTCTVCNKSFDIERSRKDQKTCSIKCGHISTGLTRQQKFQTREYYKRPIKECLTCGIKFDPKRLDQKFCSKKCKGEYQSQQPYEKTPARLVAYAAKRGVRRDPEIGKKISKVLKAANRKGPNNPKWKFENASRDRDRKLIDYKNWRLSVFQRDNFTCVICGVTQDKEYIHADHIERWVDAPEKRYEVSNGRTLCRRCHYFVTYGKIMPESSNWGKSTKHKLSKIK